MTYLPEINKRANFLASWILKTYSQCVSEFASLPGAKVLKLDVSSGPAVFVPGTRTDRALLVAHYDTVPGDTHNSDHIIPKIWGTRLYNSVSKTALGADDRAGVAALWALRKFGHSLLIVPDEEIGCIGSGEVAAKYSKLLSKHNFAIQFDRRGGDDLVFYKDTNKEFHRFCEIGYPFFSKTTGTFSDICELCPVLGFSGLNVSIGFRAEHTSNETLDLLEWCRTVEFSRKLLSRKSLPKFKFEGPTHTRQNWKSNKATVVTTGKSTTNSSVGTTTAKGHASSATYQTAQERAAAWGTSRYKLAEHQDPVNRIHFKPTLVDCEYVNEFNVLVKCKVSKVPNFYVFKLVNNGTLYLKACDGVYFGLWGLTAYEGKLTYQLYVQLSKNSQASIKTLGWKPSKHDPLLGEPSTERKKAEPLKLVDDDTTNDDTDLIFSPKDYDASRKTWNKMCPDCAMEYQPDDIDVDGLCYVCRTKLVDIP